MALTFGELVTAAISGGFGAKVLDWIHDEWKRRSGETRSGRQVVERHLDPILKSADELVGKVRSLAVADFSDFRPETPAEVDADIEFLSTMYLFAQLWSWLQILRRESVYVELSSVPDGRRLQGFMSALEATRVRLVTRAVQRGIGEALIEAADKPRTVSLYEFVRRYAEPQKHQLHLWLDPLKELLLESQNTSSRQRILVYGAVVHAMIDTLDPDHKVTRRRPGWGNKLSKKSRRELEFRVFRVYLPFVERPYVYTRPPENESAR